MSRSSVGRLVAVSPHLDDAVLSVGAFLGDRSDAGTEVVILTVFAGDPESGLSACNWDRLGGYETEGDATRARREEDAAACAIVGARPLWLPFSDWPYVDNRDERAIFAALEDAVREEDMLLVPGFPLLHPDHRFVCECILRGRVPCRSLGLYVEQPYRYRVRRREDPALDQSLVDFVGVRPAWQALPAQGSARLRKRRAVQAYRSQLPPLGLGAWHGLRLRLMLRHEARRGGELVAWVR